MEVEAEESTVLHESSVESPQNIDITEKIDENADSDDEEISRSRKAIESDSDDDFAAKKNTSKRITRIIDDEDEEIDQEVHKDSDPEDKDEEEEETLNTSRKVMKRLNSLCDDDSSDEERIDEESPKKSSPLSDSEDNSNSTDAQDTLPVPPKEKLPQRKAKAEAEHVISMIQKNAREEELSVPYNCPEQQNLKDFLEKLKSRKANLIVEEKVEMKTHKFKLPSEIPKLDVPVLQEFSETALEVTPGDSESAETPKIVPPVTEKLTLKGDPNSMIDLETGQTFAKKTIADKLISSLFKHNRKGVQSNDPKMKPEPVPGAPLKELKRNLESELQRKRKETILKILEVEKVAKDEEEELLEDEEFELDSDDETKKKPMKKKKDPEVTFNENEEIGEENDEEEGKEREAEEIDAEGEEDNQEGNEDDEDPEDDQGEEEENEEENSSSEEEQETPEISSPGTKKPLRRIVAMEEDSDEEEEKLPKETIPSSAPPLDEIPTEPLFGFDFPSTQNDNELFSLCSGKFVTQLPEVGDQPVEASQVRDFCFPTENSEENEKEIETEEKEKNLEEEEEEAGGQKLLISSSEDEADDMDTKEFSELKEKQKNRKKKKKKRIFIQEDEDEEEILPGKVQESEDEEDVEEEEEEDDDADTLPNEPIEELEEYNNFLTGKPKEEKRERMKVTDFLEKEAELSDSEWGSEDEDERGLDRVEDIGLVRDDEEFDGEELRDQVGRLHMRQMANEDNRELKYLKDMILNEEEMDGQARQRQFRWQNVNNENDDFNAKTENPDDPGDGNQSSDDDETEANWRKARLEREQALQNADKANLTIQSKLEAVMRQTKDIRVVKPMTNSPDVVLKENSSPSFLMQEQSKKYMNLRQSFLLRDDETLSRLATISAKADGTTASDGKQNFVFRRIEEKPTTPIDPEPPKKRKSNGLPTTPRSNPLPKKRKV